MSEEKNRKVRDPELEGLAIELKEREYSTKEIEEQLEWFEHHHHHHESSGNKKKESFFSREKHSPLEDDASSEPRKVEIKASPVLIVLMIVALMAFVGGIYYFGKRETVDNDSLAELSQENYAAQEEQRNAEKEKIEAEKLKRESDSFYQKLADGFDVNILLVGDGIANGSDASSPDKKWFEIVSGMIHEKYGMRAFVKNIAQWGVTSYTGFAKAAALPDDVQYDMVFVCVGQYDGTSDFGIYYEGLLRALRKKYPKASLLLFLEHSQKDYTKKIKAIQEIGEHYALPMVDMVGAFKDDYENLVNNGRTYQNDAGNALYAEKAMEVIERQVSEGRGHDDEVEPLDERALSFENAKYYSVKAFRRNGTVFTLEESIDADILGVDCVFTKGNTMVNVVVDNGAFVEMNIPYDGEFDRRCAIVANDWMGGVMIHSNESIRIEFDASEGARADSFKGIVVSSKSF